MQTTNNNKNTMIFTNATLWFGRNHALIHDKTFFLKIIFCFLFCAPLLWTCHLGLIFTHFVDLPIWIVEPWIIITQYEIHNYNYTIQQYSDSAQIHPKRFSSHARISFTFFGQWTKRWIKLRQKIKENGPKSQSWGLIRNRGNWKKAIGRRPDIVDDREVIKEWKGWCWKVMIGGRWIIPSLPAEIHTQAERHQ